MDAKQNILGARITETMERFDLMIEYMKCAIDKKGWPKMTGDERKLFIMACRKEMRKILSQSRAVDTIAQNPKYETSQDVLKSLKNRNSSDIGRLCDEILPTVEKCLQTASDDLQKIQMLTMKGEIYSNVSQITTSHVQKAKEKARDAFHEAFQLYGPACNPIILERALQASDFSMTDFHHQAETALTDGLDKIDEASEEDFHATKEIIELLKERISLWKDEQENCVDDL